MARLDLLPTGVRAFGSSSPGCIGPLAIGLTSMPRIGNAAFRLTCSSVPPGSAGFALLAWNALASPVRWMATTCGSIWAA